MCGIVGMLHVGTNGFAHSDFALMKDMLICDAIRGADSTGLFQVNSAGNSKWVKIATHPHNLFTTTEYKDFERSAWSNGQMLVGHNRKATQGAVNNGNAHPFTHGNITLVHNGGIDNFKSLVDHRQRDKHGIEVDSHGIAYLLAKNPIEYVLKELKGAFAMVWYDALKKELYMVRNGERPLAMLETETRYYMASESPMLHWLVPRYGAKKLSHTILKAGVLVTVRIEKENLITEHKEVKLYESPSYHIIHPKADSSVNLSDHAAKARANFLARKRAEEEFYNSKSVREFSGEIPFEHRYNIHYGNDQPVFPEGIEGWKPFQQIVFKIDDWKEIEGVNDTYLCWGRALNSSKLLVRFNFSGPQTELDKIVSAEQLIGLIDRVKLYSETEETKLGYKQLITIRYPKPVSMLVSPNGVPLTEEHFMILSNAGSCECGTQMSDFQIADKEQVNYYCSGLDVKMKCQWCIDAEASAEKEGKAA